MPMKRMFVYCLGGLAMMLASAAAAHAQDLKLRISFASPYNTYCAPYLVAKEMGWLAEEGLATTDIVMNGDANATRALVTGSSDMAMTGPLNVFNGIESGAQIKWIGSWQKSVDYVVVAPSKIKSLNELADKTFASSGPSGLPQVLPVMLFKKMGIAADKVKFVSVGGHAARLQAVIAGKADGAIVNEITAIAGQKAGGVHVLASVADHFPKLGYIVLAVRNSDLADASKRRAFEALMRASIRGARFIMDNPEKAAELVQRHIKGVDAETIAQVLKRLNAQNVWPVDGGVDDGVTTFTSDLEYELGETKTKFTPDQVSDGSIVKKVLAEGVR